MIQAYGENIRFEFKNGLAVVIYNGGCYKTKDTISVGVLPSNVRGLELISWNTSAAIIGAGLSMEGRSYDLQVARNITNEELAKILYYVATLESIDCLPEVKDKDYI